ncbi:MAG: STAS/SEC14 domain-containing protein [Bacteroidetes bacterium]|jgi:hypothetical protein|nr:STAS/SEC14 domain-containing protein [Bacteroidota bacterium]
MKRYATVDSTSFPLILVRFTGEKATDENFPLYLKEVEASYDRENRIGILFDATQAPFPGLKYQKMQAQWLKDHKSLMQNYCAGTAYVIPNLVIRNVLKAIFALQKQPVPYTVCANMEEAEEWLKTQLQASSSE